MHERIAEEQSLMPKVTLGDSVLINIVECAMNDAYNEKTEYTDNPLKFIAKRFGLFTDNNITSYDTKNLNLRYHSLRAYSKHIEWKLLVDIELLKITSDSYLKECISRFHPKGTEHLRKEMASRLEAIMDAAKMFDILFSDKHSFQAQNIPAADTTFTHEHHRFLPNDKNVLQKIPKIKVLKLSEELIHDYLSNDTLSFDFSRKEDKEKLAAIAENFKSENFHNIEKFEKFLKENLQFFYNGKIQRQLERDSRKNQPIVLAAWSSIKP